MCLRVGGCIYIYIHTHISVGGIGTSSEAKLGDRGEWERGVQENAVASLWCISGGVGRCRARRPALPIELWRASSSSFDVSFLALLVEVPGHSTPPVVASFATAVGASSARARTR